mmetsp:Transcript_22631/g.64716  ORF Transcript_22631/g.64716 Transcript_22631/m.64716 type:complete len:105 (+) Transcript_22631:186-500(+)
MIRPPPVADIGTWLRAGGSSHVLTLLLDQWRRADRAARHGVNQEASLEQGCSEPTGVPKPRVCARGHASTKGKMPPSLVSMRTMLPEPHQRERRSRQEGSAPSQ